MIEFDLAKVYEEARKKALKKRMEYLATLPYKPVNVPMREILFGLMSGRVSYDSYQCKEYNTTNYFKSFNFKTKTNENNKLSNEDKKEFLIQHFFDYIDFEVDYKLYNLKEEEIKDDDKIINAIIKKHSLDSNKNLNLVFEKIIKNHYS